jgi:hypothetical protein
VRLKDVQALFGQSQPVIFLFPIEPDKFANPEEKSRLLPENI